MKILMTNSFYPPYHVGGADTHVKYFAEELVKEGHEVHVLFSLDAFKMKRPYEKKEFDSKGVIIHPMESPKGKAEPVLNYTIATQAYTQKYFNKLVKEMNFDVVHHHNISLLGNGILAKQGNYRNFYTAHDYWLVCPKFDLFKFGKICETKVCLACAPMHGKPYPLYRALPSFRDTIKKDVDTIFAPSSYMKSRILREFSNRTEVLWNFAPDPPKKIPEGKDKDYFIFVGQLEKHKGILPLIEVFSKLDDKMVILGKGSLEEEIKKRIEGKKNIHYAGWASSHEEALSYIQNAKALILPSLWAENNPMVLLEALSVGTPIIGSSNGGIPEIVNMVDSSLLFDPKDFSSLSAIIKNFNPAKYSRETLIGVFEENFSWKAFRKKIGGFGYFG